MDKASVGGAPTQNRLPLLSLGEQEKADFAPMFGGEHTGSEIGSEYGFPVSNGAASGSFWTNDMLGHGVGGAGGAGMAEKDPVHRINGESS